MKLPFVSRAKYDAIVERTEARVQDSQRLIETYREFAASAQESARQAKAESAAVLTEAVRLSKQASETMFGKSLDGPLAPPATVGSNDRKAAMAIREAAEKRGQSS